MTTTDALMVCDLRHQRNGQIRIYREGGRYHVANVLASGPTPEADAALFAAAPDMLAALHDIRLFLGKLDQPSISHAVDLVIGDVIERATGRNTR